MTNITIAITSDPCYMGKKRLDKAIELYKKVYPGGRDDTFTISWHAFYLDPSAPKQGIPWLERHVQRFGPEKATALQDRLASIGRQHGITFSFAGKIGNTRDAHRLILMSGTKGPEAQDRVVMELFRDHFEGEGDVTSHDTLLRVAEKAGLDRDEAKGWLEGGDGGEQVDAEVQRALERSVTGVPSFIIQDKYEIDGAQDEQDFLEYLIKAKEAEAA
ncbi:hypothetical protein VMCG_01227 [Cytospora schulzeri]|uniref:DSBA-like thioredoxin domain-containing protein n=1 Tax=Cytospora schulzeri TaxID=448051 RepID=A0A423X6D5_9PEZI|nr:hypothetical protein VMCG_01227 [Valsa malicola]